MRIEKFEDLIAWQKSRELAGLVYKKFGGSRDFDFRSQIIRCAISVMNNLAEGFERQTNKELRNFLYIAKGSCGELRSMLYLAMDLNYIESAEFKIYSDRSLEISRIISGLIKTL